MPIRAKTDKLPDGIKAEIYQLYQKGFKLTDIADAVNEVLVEKQEDPILNKDNVHRLLKKREATLAKVQQSREIGELLVKQFGENNDIGKQTESIVQVGQALIMDLMVARTEDPGKNVELNVDRLASSLQSFIGALMKQQQFEEKIAKATREKIATEAQREMKNTPDGNREEVMRVLQKIGVVSAELK